MPTPALNIPIRAAGLDDFKKSMGETSAMVGTATRAITSQVIKMNAGFLASQGAAGAATLAFGSVLSILGPIALGITAVVDTFKLMGLATDLAKQKIQDYNAIADKSVTVSTDFYQRIVKSAGVAKLSVDDLTSAFNTLNQATSDKLGGSELQNRIDELQKVGNLAGNTGVSSLASANGTEEKFRAIVSLIDQAMQKGERLAGLDISAKAFGPQITTALKADAGYLDEMVKRADAISKSEIISAEDIGRAVELKNQMEAAQQILADKWKPIQEDLASLGMNYEGSWVSITEYLASAVGSATDLYKALHQVPDWFAHGVGGTSIWKLITDNTTTPESRKASEDSLGITSDPAAMAQVGATNKLRAALQNHANVTRGMQESSTVQSAVRGDKAKDPNPKETAKPERDPFDVAIDGTDKRIAALKAETATIADSTAVRERAKTVATLEEAAKRANTAAGLENTAVTDKQRAAIDKEADAMMHATAASEKAKIHDSIKTAGDTTLLSPEDAAIAEKLKTIYPDVATALGSVEANAMRVNSALKSVSGTIESGVTSALTDMMSTGRSASQTFYSMSRSIVRSIDEMVIKMLIVAPVMRSLQSAFGGGINLFGGSSSPAPGDGNFIGPVLKADGGYISGPGSSRSDSIPARLSNGEFVVNAGSTAKHRALLESMNSGHLRGFADGGFVGNVPSVPAAQYGGSGSTVTQVNHINVGGNQAGGPSQNKDLAEQIAAHVNEQAKQMVGNELRQQMRPGGILRQ
jgi:hypothetical protein